MSVKLYPNHKAILNFYDSLKVYEIELLAHLTNFLSSKQFDERLFEIYVKPTFNNSNFDFLIVEPQQAIYIIHTPKDKESFYQQREIFEIFLNSSIQELSPTLDKNLQIMNDKNNTLKLEHSIKNFYYIYDRNLFLSLQRNEKDSLLSPLNFTEKITDLQDKFTHSSDYAYSLSKKETSEIKEKLNPNTNLKNYIPKKLSAANEHKAKSKVQAKQKFKGKTQSGKTTLLVQRIINCANRLNAKGKILVVSGKPSEVTTLKELITAEDGRSLQELGITISSYQQLNPPDTKYDALFIDDAHCLKNSWLKDLLNHYLVELIDKNDYEYVVMVEENELITVPQIFGPYTIVEKQYQEISSLLSESRKIFLDILKE